MRVREDEVDLKRKEIYEEDRRVEGEIELKQRELLLKERKLIFKKRPEFKEKDNGNLQQRLGRCEQQQIMMQRSS